MTLKDAFTIWKNNPDHIVLANKSRDAVQRVLMTKWGNVGLQDITVSKAEAMFSSSSERQEAKSKAASILVHLLQWGAEHGYCLRPSFDYSIADPKNPEKEEETDEDMNKDRKFKGKKPEPVAQLTADTLQLVKEYPSIKEARNQTGISNIYRAVANKGLAGGYFWCDPKDIKTFKPNQRNISEQKPAAKQKPAPDEVPVSLRAAEESAHSLKFKPGDYVWSKNPQKRYGIRGCIMHGDAERKVYEVSYGDEIWMIEEKDLVVATEPFVAGCVLERDTSAVTELLTELTDEELWKELERRGWEGELSRRQVVTIGTAK